MATTTSPRSTPLVASNPSANDSAAPPSFWSLKPWWCQPWSIVSTGIVGMLGSWLILHRLWISLPIALAVALWWGLFLVVVPSAYKASLQQDASSDRHNA